MDTLSFKNNIINKFVKDLNNTYLNLLNEEYIKKIEETVELDWIFNIEEQYIKKVNIGKYAICEVPDNNLKTIVLSCTKNVYLHTKYKEWLLLQNKKIFTIEVEGFIKKVWFCKIITFSKLLETSSLKDVITEEEKIEFNKKNLTIEIVNVIYGRCVDSMTFLDKVYREYVYKHKFNKNEIVSIKSVAGSGKTTTLLELAKIHKNKNILYIAFNKSLITEIKEKIVDQKIRNLNPCTFDSLMRSVFISKYDDEFELMDLKPQTLPNVISWFANKPYRIKNYYVKAYNKFCNQTRYSTINEYCKKVLGGEKKLLSQMWEKSLNHELITFDFIRKYVELESLCKNYIDNKYDLIFIDESQDFDNVMLKILLEDTSIPKLFVGDPKQAIYEWKGCINAFDKLPSTTLALEFYSTFRVGLPACNEIRDKFKSCNIISRSKNITNILYDVVPTEKYVYLFRGWKNLLQTAQNLENIWIHNFDSQIEFIKRLHNKMQISNLDEDELNEFSDDLPKFLLKLSLEDLEKLINDIQKNIVVKNKCNVEMYTIHSYKGLESDIVRIFNDVELPKEENLYYVALTRGMKQIIIDTVKPIYEDAKESKKQMKMTYFGVNTIILD